MLQLALVATGFSVVTTLMVWGSLTPSVNVKRVLFWTMFLGIGSATYFFSRSSH